MPCWPPMPCSPGNFPTKNREAFWMPSMESSERDPRGFLLIPLPCARSHLSMRMTGGMTDLPVALSRPPRSGLFGIYSVILRFVHPKNVQGYGLPYLRK